MQILQAKAHLNEELPDLTLSETATHLALQVLAQIAILAVLHHYVELVTLLERVIKVDHVSIVQFIHKKGLTQRFLLLRPAHLTKVDLLHHIDLLSFFADDPVDDAK